MRNIWKRFWPYLVTVVGWVAVGMLLIGCERCSRNGQLEKENEQLREELTRTQEYVPLIRERFRDSLEAVKQSVRPVEKVKATLTKEDRELLKELGAKVSAIVSYQKVSTETRADVKLSSDAVAANTTDVVAANATDSAKTDAYNERDPPGDSVLVYKDAWLDVQYHTNSQHLLFNCKDSLAISVEKAYKKRFLWWRWGVKGYEVKAVSFSPYSTIKYNRYVKAYP